MDATPIDPDLARRCERARVESGWQFLRFHPGAQRQEIPEGWMVRCDVPADTANQLFLFGASPPFEVRFRAAKAFFGPKVPWRVIASGPHVTEVGVEATRLGLRAGPTQPSMILDPIPDPPPLPAGFAVRTVARASELADFGEPWCRGFGIPKFAFPAALPRVIPDDPPHGIVNRMFVGYREGTPVACATVTVSEGVGEIGSVAVVPEMRGRGYGRAITWAAAIAAREARAEAASLIATAMGEPVYTKMGFRRMADLSHWSVHFGIFRMLGVYRTVRRIARQMAATSP